MLNDALVIVNGIGELMAVAGATWSAGFVGMSAERAISPTVVAMETSAMKPERAALFIRREC